MNPKQALGIAFPLTVRHLPLIGQKRRRLGEKHTKGAQRRIFHPVAAILALAFVR
jgi:hypothetical protein